MHSAALEVMNTIVTISAGQGTKEPRPTSFQLEAYMVDIFPRPFIANTLYQSASTMFMLIA